MDCKNNPALLFYLSGQQTTADYAVGPAEPMFDEGIEVAEGGVKDKYLIFDGRDVLAWKAEQNIYAERGTISFWWRSAYPVGPTAFPIFRVGYADHSSWDQSFLRIDYNGEGIEAYVSDINLARARVWYTPDVFPAPDEWMHIVVSWDELWGLKLYFNGKPVACEERPAVYYAGLYGFGPHSRIIGAWHVQTDYNFVRGGELCELSIWDQMLSDEEVATLHEVRLPEVPAYTVQTETWADAKEEVRDDFLFRNGMNGYIPRIPETAAARKVEVTDAYDLKRWWYKGMDGIRETTWPGVYNRSRLKGRNDYFQLPDWDCYSLSGKAITFHLPYEPYNHLEISGSAYGKVEIVDDDGSVKEELFERAPGQERTEEAVPNGIGDKIRFTNVEKEEPIGDFSVFNVYEGRAPKGAKSVTYKVLPGRDTSCEGAESLYRFIDGRFTRYERNVYTAVPEGADAQLTGAAVEGYPFYNIVIPYEADDAYGLDGVELCFDTLEGADAVYSVQVKDPLWYFRNLAQFTFRANPGKVQKLWLDTRDRILPVKRSMYLTIAVSCPKAAAKLMETLQIRTVFKKAEDAKAEHVHDRFTQVRDITGHMTEESPFDNRYYTWNRFQRDILDLLKVEPGHNPGCMYYAMMLGRTFMRKAAELPDYLGNPMPPAVVPDLTEPVPEGVPAWAYKQVEYLRHYKKIIQFYIDKRQIANGELGGGLSDDGDFVATWGAMALMDSFGEKVAKAMEANEQAFYDQGMFTNGLCSIQADELHSSEEGQVSLAACLNIRPGSPHWLENAMETARQIEWVTGVNSAGHRHLLSCYYSGSVIAREDPWGSQQSCGNISLEVAWQIAQFNGNPKLLALLKEMADSLAAHYHEDEDYVHSYIRFDDDYEVPTISRRRNGDRALLMPAAVLLGDDKYRKVMVKGDLGGMTERDSGYPLHPFKTGTDIIDKDQIAKRYDVLNQKAAIKEYYCTDGHPWIDRVYCEPCALYCDRLADPSDVQVRCTFPMNRIAWKFTNWGDDERVAIISPICEEDHLRIVAHNLSDRDVLADLYGWTIKPGVWEVTYGVDTDDDDRPNEQIVTHRQVFENTVPTRVVFPAGETSVVELKLVEEGLPYWQRPDLGVSEHDVMVFDHGINVRIHSLGAVASPEVDVVLKDADGKVLKRATLPSLEAPADLLPRTREVIFYLHHLTEKDLKGAYVEIDPDHKLHEITRMNNIVKIDKAIRARKPILS